MHIMCAGLPTVQARMDDPGSRRQQLLDLVMEERRQMAMRKPKAQEAQA